MPQDIPPLIEPPKTLIGVGLRELIVLATTGLLAILILFLPVLVALRVGLAVLVAGMGIASAFGRDPRSGKTIEGYLKDRLRYAGRVRFFQRGALGSEVPGAAASTPPGAQSVPAAAWVRLRPLPLGLGLWFTLASLSVLAALLAWVWLGGAAEISGWITLPRGW